MTTVIIGNGILSLTTALRLALRAGIGDKVIVIGKNARPGSATMAAGAMLNSFCEIEVGSLETDIDISRFDLSYRASKMWPQFVLDYMDVALHGNCLIKECHTCQGSHGACFELGTYLINNCATDSLEDENYAAIIKALDDFYEPYTVVDPQDIPNYNPQARNRATKAIYIPNEGWLNPKLTLRAIDAIVEHFPCVEFIDANVDRIIQSGNLIESVLLTDGRQISGDKYILATGATASDLIEKSNLGISIPRIFYGVGVSIQISSPAAQHTKTIRTPNRGLACGLYTVPYYLSPWEQSEILIGSSSYVSPVPLYNAKVGSTQSLLNMAMEQVNTDFYKATVSAINVGCRPVSADTYPVIGKTSIPNFIVVTGTKRDGFHLAPVISEALTQMVYDEPYDTQFDHFKPERKLIRQQTREEAIEASVKHMLNANYQHGFVPSQDKLADRLKKMYRDELEALHDQVGAFDWGIPTELVDMYRYNHIKA